MTNEDDPDVGLIVQGDDVYLHAGDLIDFFNRKATDAYEFDVSMFEMFDNAAREIQQLIESKVL